MSDRKVVAIFGATGNQGGAVARSLVANKSFHVRGFTRNPDSASAKALEEIGVEIVKADGWKQDQMESALNGAWGSFVNTNSDDPIFHDGSGQTEYQLGKLVVDAAIAAKVKHIVYSSAASPEEITDGKFKMPTMTFKNQIEQYIRNSQKFESCAFVNAGWYMEFFQSKEVAPLFGGFPYFPDSDGVLTFCCPRWGGDRRVPWLSVLYDFGDMVQGIFLDPARWNGKIIHGASDLVTFDAVTGAFENVTGQKAQYKTWMPDWTTWETHGIEALEIAKEMFGFVADTEGCYMGREPTDVTYAAELKKTAAAAIGKSGKELELTTIDQFFSREFVSVA